MEGAGYDARTLGRWDYTMVGRGNAATLGLKDSLIGCTSCIVKSFRSPIDDR